MSAKTSATYQDHVLSGAAETKTRFHRRAKRIVSRRLWQGQAYGLQGSEFAGGGVRDRQYPPP
jgi:hypothetical protein